MVIPDYPAELPAVALDCLPETTLGYAALTNDHNPLHVDPAFAATTPFGGPIAHGTMALNLLLTGIEQSVADAFRIDHVQVRFVAPTPLPNRLVARAVLEAAATGTYSVAVTRDDGTEVLSGTVYLVTNEGTS